MLAPRESVTTAIAEVASTGSYLNEGPPTWRAAWWALFFIGLAIYIAIRRRICD